VRRRSLVLLLATGSLATGSLAACSSRRSGTPAAAATPRAAVADDYRWFTVEPDFGKGFCFTWVKGLTPRQVLARLNGDELERITWPQLVGAGDGPTGVTDRYYIGVTRVEGWALIVEDNGELGVDERLVRPLSRDTTVVTHQRGADGHGRFLLLQDGAVQLDFDPSTPAKTAGGRAAELRPMIASVGFGVGDDPARPIRAAFALAERLTGTTLTEELLRTSTYLFTEVPRPTN
jgi:hypothetical protein